jgi:anti-sigma-K factor RskA
MNEEQTAMWYEDRVEAFIDGDLPDNEARMFAARLQLDRDLKESVEAGLALQGALAAMPKRKCPPSVSRKVFEETGTGWKFWNFSHQWAWAAAASAAVLAIVLNLSLLSPQVVDPGQPTVAELEQAREDLAVAMAYLGHASNVASREVSRQILSEGFVRPMSAGLNRSRTERQTGDADNMEDAS